MNDFRTSMTALEIDAPQLSATQLVARPGTLPTLAFPVTGSVAPDVLGIWAYLRGPADFFGVPMPSLDELAAALAGSSKASPSYVTVTIAERDGAPQVLVTRAAVTPVRAGAVRIAGGDPSMPTQRATDPAWRRMAARTTSRGEADHLERWLTGRGFVDAIVAGAPLLGALAFVDGAGVVGVENPEPTSILDQLEQCGAIDAVARRVTLPANALRAWWISPRYEIHPVVEIDGTTFPVGPEAGPPFTRWS